ncbi:MAG: iron ABC transporter permease [candidate division NC10 bacterium]|nr:iron ABC transporter permease [candidate division NC10 bacterium]MBI4842066.1 iron ABC transporter permease [candidate division NC10 bacterium]
MTAYRRETLVWSLLTLGAFAALPWERVGKAFLVLSWSRTALGQVSSHWSLAMVGGAASLAILLALVGGGSQQAGRLLLSLSSLGLLAGLIQLFTTGHAFGLGALISLFGLLTLAGIGLAQAGYLRGGAFVGAGILWAAGLVAIFILFPLGVMLQASVVIQGSLTTSGLLRYLRSPIFLLLRHPELPVDPIRWGIGVGVATGLIAVLTGWGVTRRTRASLVWGGSIGVGAGLLTMLILGMGALRNSLFLAVIVSLISTSLGFAFALLESRSRLWTRCLLGPLSILPIITPAFVLGLAMIYMFGRRGFITHTLLGLSTNAFFGPLGVGVAQVLAFTPIAYLVLVGVIHAMDISLEEAAQTLRADRWTLFRTILWPLMRPGLANAILLVMIESLADFGNPLLLGGGVPFLPTEIFYAIEGRFDQHEAATYGLILLMITLTIFFFQRYWLGRRSYVTVTGKPSGGRPIPLPLGADLALTGVFLAFAGVAALLYGSIFFGSFVKLWGIDHTFTLKNYRDLLSHGLPVLLDTMRLSVLAAFPSAGLGFLIAYLTLRHRFVGRTALEFSAMLSYAIPGTVMGIGYILAFNTGALHLTGTAAIIVLAFIFRGMPVGIRSGIAALTQLDPSLEEASATLKAGTATTLRRVVVPLIRSAILTGLIYSFVRAMTAVSQVIFLVSPGHDLVTVLILSWAEYGTIGRGAALSTLLILVLAACILPAHWLGRRRPVGVEAAAN